jgi:alpha-galactosidase
MREKWQKIISTGWQSWSNSNFLILKRLKCNSPPFVEIPPKNFRFFPSKLKPPAKGWCSWYAFGDDINEEEILNQVKWFSQHREIPIKYILIDDGYASHGDWLTPLPERFPSGLKSLAQKIKTLGFKPGLWIAPFWADPASNLAKNHPGWLVQNQGKPLSYPFWDNLVTQKHYLLDIRLPNVESYLKKIIKTLTQDFGFELLKLDFLYYPYFYPQIKPRIAFRLLRNFLLEIKRQYSNVYTIGCGCPLLPALGAIDSMRIGPDITRPSLNGIPLLNRFINTYLFRAVSDNVKKRLFTKMFWNLDPDVFVCSPQTGFSENQILSLQKTIKDCRGNVFLGDDMTKLTDEKIDKFIFPLFQT